MQEVGTIFKCIYFTCNIFQIYTNKLSYYHSKPHNFALLKLILSIKKCEGIKQWEKLFRFNVIINSDGFRVGARTEANPK